MTTTRKAATKKAAAKKAPTKRAPRKRAPKNEVPPAPDPFEQSDETEPKLKVAKKGGLSAEERLALMADPGFEDTKFEKMHRDLIAAGVEAATESVHPKRRTKQ